MAWTDLSGAFTYGSKLTSTQMQQLRDNIEAAFNKDGGAPVLANDYVNSAMIAGNNVGQGHMDSGLESVTINDISTTGDNVYKMVIINGVVTTTVESHAGGV